MRWIWLTALAGVLAASGCTKSSSKSGGAAGASGATYTPPGAVTPNLKCQKSPSGAGSATGSGTGTDTGATINTTTAPTPTTGSNAAAAASPTPTPAAATNTGSTLALDDSAATPTPTPAAAAPGATWSAVKTIIQNSCIGSCHTHDSLLTYSNAKAVAAQMVEDTDLDPSDPNFMPQGGTRLALGDREKLVLWLNAGTPDDASDVAPAPTGADGAATDVGTVDGKSRFTAPSDAGPAADGC